MNEDEHKEKPMPNEEHRKLMSLASMYRRAAHRVLAMPLSEIPPKVNAAVQFTAPMMEDRDLDRANWRVAEWTIPKGTVEMTWDEDGEPIFHAEDGTVSGPGDPTRPRAVVEGDTFRCVTRANLADWAK